MYNPIKSILSMTCFNKNLKTFQLFLQLVCMNYETIDRSQCYRLCNMDENLNVNSLERYVAELKKVLALRKFITSQYPLLLSKICSISPGLQLSANQVCSLYCPQIFEKTHSIGAELAGRNFHNKINNYMNLISQLYYNWVLLDNRPCLMQIRVTSAHLTVAAFHIFPNSSTHLGDINISPGIIQPCSSINSEERWIKNYLVSSKWSSPYQRCHEKNLSFFQTRISNKLFILWKLNGFSFIDTVYTEINPVR